MNCMRGVVLLTMSLLLVLLPAVADEPDHATPDERTLRAAEMPTDGAALLDFFRKRTVSDTQWLKIRSLIRRLGDNSYPVRERASHDLAAMGLPALPLLREALRDADLEIARRAEECLHLVEEKDPGRALPAAAARLVALRKPSGATAVLLAYLPAADDDVVAEEVRSALAVVAAADPDAEKVLVAALSDKTVERRATAAGLLCRVGSPARRTALREFLQDPEPLVRLRVGLALAAKERAAFPVLIELLSQLPLEQAWEAEDLLHRLAGKQAPEVSLGPDANQRRQCRDAWASWWRAHGDKADLARLTETPGLQGYTLIVLLDVGRVLELRPNDRVRWQIDRVDFPLDAQALPGDRVLLAEHGGNVVTERNRRGEVLWRYDIEGPLMAQRLPNGNTFLANQHQMLEVDHRGREVAVYLRPGGENVMKAQKLPNGDIAAVMTAGIGQRFVRLDPAGNKELHTFPVQVKTSGGRIDVLPNGNVLVPELKQDRVVECEPQTGRPVWQAEIEEPVAAVRLPNGHTLVTSMKGFRAVEFDRTGRKELWEYKENTRVTRAFRR